MLEYGVPEGSVLRPLLYSLYTTPLLSIISKYPGISSQFYADHSQIYLSFLPKLTTVVSLIESCIRDIFSWMVANKLSVNPNKMEYFLFNAKHFNNPNCSIDIDSNTVSPNESAKKFSVIFQSDMSMVQGFYCWADHVSPGCDTLLYLEIRPFLYLSVLSQVTGHVDLIKCGMKISNMVSGP